MKNAKIKPNRISKLRRRINLTQKELGKLMDLDNTTIAKHESRARNITESEVKKYAKIFKVDTYELFMEPVEDDTD